MHVITRLKSICGAINKSMKKKHKRQNKTRIKDNQNAKTGHKTKRKTEKIKNARNKTAKQKNEILKNRAKHKSLIFEN